MSALRSTARLLPYLLGIACVIPVGAGLYRAGELLWSWNWTLHFVADSVDRLPLFVHAITGLTFLALGAVQIVTGTRRTRRNWHRKAGRFTAISGILAALSGISMTLIHPEISGPLLHYSRLFFGVLWIVFLVLAIEAILVRDIHRHHANVIRAYAIAINAGTIPFVYLPVLWLFGQPAPIFDEAIQVAGWIVNLLAAEWIIRRGLRASRLALPAPLSAAPVQPLPSGQYL